MARKLELDEEQVKQLAQILSDLKTERAQAEVDERRTISRLADAFEGGTFDDAKVKEGLDIRVKSAEALRDAVQTALEKTYAILNEEQRAKLAYMLRSGALSI